MRSGDWTDEELLTFELPDLGALRASVERVVEAFQETASTLTLTGNPGDTMKALNRAANTMVEFAKEHERYWAAADGVRLDPYRASLAHGARSRAKKEQG